MLLNALENVLGERLRFGYRLGFFGFAFSMLYQVPQALDVVGERDEVPLAGDVG